MSLVVEWVRLCLSMWGTWIQSLVREDATCRGATKAEFNNYTLEACTLDPVLCNKRKVKVLVTQSCPTLWDLMDCSPQAPLSMEFSRQEYWSGLPFFSPGDLPNSGIKPRSPVLQGDSLPSEPPGKPTTREATATRSPCAARQSSPSSLQLQKALTQQQRPSATKKIIKKQKKTESGIQVLQATSQRHHAATTARNGFYLGVSQTLTPADTSLSDFWLPVL